MSDEITSENQTEGDPTAAEAAPDIHTAHEAAENQSSQQLHP